MLIFQNYASILEKKQLGYEPAIDYITESTGAPDMQTEDGLKRLLSGQNPGSYTPQWNQLISDYESKKGKPGTYTVTINHDNGKPMITVDYQIGADGKPVKGSIVLSSKASSAGAVGTEVDPNTKLTANVLDKLKSRAKYLTNKTNVDEVQLAQIFSAILYHSISNSLTLDQRSTLINKVFSDAHASKTSAFKSFWSMSSSGGAGATLAKIFLQSGQISIDLENDNSCKKVVSIVGSKPAIASVNVTDQTKISELAQAIFDILDDNFVSEDEELIAMMGILALNRDSFVRLVKKWDQIHKENAGGKSLGSYCSDELDDSDTRAIFAALYNALAGKPSDGAKALLTEPA